MRLTCPCCGYVGDPEGYLAEGAWREAVACAAKLPAPLADRVLRYIGLFRPQQRSLSPDRAAKLLAELLDPIAAASVERNGRTWTAPLDLWAAALDDMLTRRDSLTLPLRSHGYLYEVVAGLANAAEGRAERAAEQIKAHPASRVHVASGGLQKVGPTDEFRALVASLKRGKSPQPEEVAHVDPAD